MFLLQVLKNARPRHSPSNFFRSFAQEVSSLKHHKIATRSHTCGELRLNHVGSTVKLCGWVEFLRMDKFVTLRDAYGTIQIIIPDGKSHLTDIIKNLPLESVIEVDGRVIARPPEQENMRMETGAIEVEVSDIRVLNKVTAKLPFIIRNFQKPQELLRLKYRYLDLRNPRMQKILRMRSGFLMKMRKYLINHLDFVEVETPTLFKKTPGGAQEFIVPTQYPGEFYSLVQSPQQLKQLLMVGGLDRYFQVARCYRDEGTRPDRQPEFTQLDVELSFATPENVMSIIEGLLEYSWPVEYAGPLKFPFRRMTYNESMESYGTDQPDLTILPKTYFKGSLKKEYELLKETLFPNCRLSIIKVSEAKLDSLAFVSKEKVLSVFNVENNDLLFIAYGEKTHTVSLLGKLRVAFGKYLRNKGFQEDSWFSHTKFIPVWLTDFPLFEKCPEGKLKACHHPFTQPHSEDTHLLYSDPLKVRSLHYDLVLNGWEIGGGSQRIHNAQFQEEILTQFLKIPIAGLKHLIDALASGAPPHAGIALGIDRILAIITGAKTIREVIAFPKGGDGRDYLSGCPSPVSGEELNLYHILPVTHGKTSGPSD